MMISPLGFEDDDLDEDMVIDPSLTTTTTVVMVEAPSVRTTPRMTGRLPLRLYLSCDDDHFSAYQVLVRKQIELFEANTCDAQLVQGRNKPVVAGQVGIRCMYCRAIDPKQRGRGAVYYPTTLEGLYQASQNMATLHLEECPFIPEPTRGELARLRASAGKSSSGKAGWAHKAKELGVYVDEHGLRFETLQTRMDKMYARKLQDYRMEPDDI